MKLSFAISLQNTGFAYIAGKDRWQDKIKLLSSLGYEGVELSIRNPAKVDIAALEKILNNSNLQLSAIGTGQAYIDEGLSLSSLDAKIRKRAVERIKQQIDLAKYFNAQVIIGLIRGKKEDQSVSSKKYEKNFSTSLRHICDYARSRDVLITIEPLNRYETSFLNKAEEVLTCIKKLKSSNLRILLDTFHMNIEENNFTEPIKKSIKYLSHFHIADNNRRYPGQGSIDFKKIILNLGRLGYEGYLSGEMLPAPSDEYCIRKFFKTIKPYAGA